MSCSAATFESIAVRRTQVNRYGVSSVSLLKP
jgi:hypothetical protein